MKMKIQKSKKRTIYKIHVSSTESTNEINIFSISKLKLMDIKIQVRHGVKQKIDDITAENMYKLLNDILCKYEGKKKMFVYLLGRSFVKENHIMPNKFCEPNFDHYVLNQPKKTKHLIHDVFSINLKEKRKLLYSDKFIQIQGGFSAFVAMFVSLLLIGSVLMIISDNNPLELTTQNLFIASTIYVLKDRIKENMKKINVHAIVPQIDRKSVSEHLKIYERLEKIPSCMCRTLFGDESTFLYQYKYTIDICYDKKILEYIVPSELEQYHSLVIEIDVPV